MRYLDVCAGISASTVAWKPLGWQAAAYSEIEPAPRAILAHHYPDVPLHGDFTTIAGDEYGPIDLLVGGTPCQDFSVAGLRAGLAGDRGNLSLEFLRLADRARPRWLVWENVPGVLSINGGRAFGAILGGMGELGYGFAYRVLDAQHFGVPQRRRRVFVVGYLGDWRRAAAVLFERHSLSGHPAPRRRASEDIAPTVAGGARKRGGYSCDDIPAVAATLSAAGSRSRGAGTDPAMLAFGRGNTSGSVDVAACLVAKGQKCGFEVETFITHSLRAEGFDTSEDGTGRGTPLVPVAFDCTAGGNTGFAIGEIAGALRVGGRSSGHAAVAFTSKDYGQDASDVAPTLRAMQGRHANAGGQVAIAFTQNSRSEVREIGGDGQIVGALAAEAGAQQQNYVAYGISGDAIDRTGEGDGSAAQRAGLGISADVATTLRTHGRDSVSTASAVRRLTPRECERLQDFPDDYTLVPYRKGMMADGPRYKALGNSMAVPVMRWIGERIAQAEALSADAEVRAA